MTHKLTPVAVAVIERPLSLATFKNARSHWIANRFRSLSRVFIGSSIDAILCYVLVF